MTVSKICQKRHMAGVKKASIQSSQRTSQDHNLLCAPSETMELSSAVIFDVNSCIKLAPMHKTVGSISTRHYVSPRAYSVRQYQ
jgi:hypothetical protein